MYETAYISTDVPRRVNGEITRPYIPGNVTPEKKQRRMTPACAIEFIDAACDTHYINGFEERGFLFFVAQPGNFKSTLILSATRPRPDTMICSKINAMQWNRAKSDFISKRKTAIVLPEFENIYKCARSTSTHTEAIIQEVTCDGYMYGPGQDPRIPRIPARALVIGGITTDCFERKYDEWDRSGFNRRGLWAMIHVRNPEEILKAIRRWEKIELGEIRIRPASDTIPMALTEDDSRKLEKWMRDQPGMYGPGYVLLKKIAAVLVWKYKRTKTPERAWQILEEFSPAFSQRGGEIIL